METFETSESAVRSYCRSFPAVFSSAQGSTLVAEDGREYIDFFAGAGSLNYGHNNPRLKQKLLSYIERDGVAQGLDMATVAKRSFLESFEELVLGPRNLSYRVQFPGPTGTNAVEAALKLARKVTGRIPVIFFTNAFHGMTLGSLSVTGNAEKRASGGLPPAHGVAMPYDGFLGGGIDTLAVLEAFLDEPGSGVGLPAAVIVETIQAEGGVNVAGKLWLQKLERSVRKRGILLVVDDIQMGCGRTGPFFSFEEAGLRPDIVCLSKSISGFGLPMALVLLREELDVWSPGEHNGTFRGNNLAFVTAAAALQEYWRDDTLAREVERKGEILGRRFEHFRASCPGRPAAVRGKGLIRGIDFSEPGVASAVSRAAFERGVIIEVSGVRSQVLKALPPLVIDDETLQAGLDRLEAAFASVMARGDADGSARPATAETAREETAESRAARKLQESAA